MSVVLDTNILTRAAQPAHPSHEDTLDALEVLRKQGEYLCIVPQNLYEFCQKMGTFYFFRQKISRQRYNNARVIQAGAKDRVFDLPKRPKIRMSPFLNARSCTDQESGRKTQAY